MPGGDRTGPLGLGPRTGRAAGYCSGYPGPGYMHPKLGLGRGLGRGRGFGRGFYGRGRGFWWRGYRDPYDIPHPYNIGINPQLSKDKEKAYLEETVKALEEDIKNIRNRIQEITKEKKEST